jgi:K+-transporting ATPase ATPase C chain
MTRLRAPLVLLLLFAALTGLAYPLVMTGIGQAAFPAAANGSLVTREGKVIGSSLVAQPFANDRYFHPRPSAAGEKGYDAANSSGSNLGPISKKFIERVEGDLKAWRERHGTGAVPVDALTASASGLDPHITPANAMAQAARVARARNLAEDRVRRLVEEHVEGRALGILGEPRVNVLMLNLALDRLGANPPAR